MKNKKAVDLHYLNHYIIPTGQEPWIDQGEYGKKTPIGVRKEIVERQINVGGEKWITNYYENISI